MLEPQTSRPRAGLLLTRVSLTLDSATLGFAWAGQLTIFHNTAETRGLYTVLTLSLTLTLTTTLRRREGCTRC